MKASPSVLVIGAGAAGLAAAWSAHREGLDVTVIDRYPGATGFSGGALDLTPWDELVRAQALISAEARNEELPPELELMNDELGLWTMPSASDPVPLLATNAGRLRPARGFDRALLDLGSMRGARVLIVDAPRPEHSARSLARVLSADPFARERALVFDAVAAPVCRFVEERVMSDGELAARHDEASRLGWLADQLTPILRREERDGRRPDAVLLGPWLGASAPRAARLSQLLERPAGETMSAMGPSGLRFEAARDRWLERAGVRVVRDRATKLRRDPRGAEILLESGDTLSASAVVLAIGGMAGGGIEYTPPLPEGADVRVPSTRLPFRLSIEADLPLASEVQTGASWWGDAPYPVDVASTMHGPELDQSAWPTASEPGALESVGLWCRGVEVEPRIFAAGDAIAARPRTLLTAMVTGLAAGRAAAALVGRARLA